jgi:hypothetical protein
MKERPGRLLPKATFQVFVCCHGVDVTVALRGSVAPGFLLGDGETCGVTLVVGAGLVKSTVGVIVGGSRVGIGP